VKLHRLVLAAAMTALFMGPAQANSLIELGANFVPVAISNDGSVISGNDRATLQPFTWTELDGIEFIGGKEAMDISGDGQIVAGNVTDNTFETAGSWNELDDWTLLGPVPGGASCDAFLSSSWGTNLDGSVVVGLGWVDGCKAHAIRWEESTGVVDLGSTVPDRSSRANDVSDDGSVTVGWQDASNGTRQGAYWTEGAFAATQTLLVTAGNAPVGEAFRANTDGSIIVGGPIFGSGHAYRYMAGGSAESIGGLSGFQWTSRALSTSEDGSVVVGFSGFGFDRAGFIWIEGEGMMNLQDYLIGEGFEIPAGWNIAAASDITPDGNVIVGYAIDESFNFQGFRVELLDVANAEVGEPQTSELRLDTSPNPFRSSTTIRYTIPTEDDVTLTVFDAKGRKVRSLFSGTVAAGQHAVDWDGHDQEDRQVSPGVYFLRASGLHDQMTTRITLLR